MRLRKRLSGTPSRPRLCVHFSGTHIYAQIVDDTVGRTVVSVATTEASIRALGVGANVETAKVVGREIASRAAAASIEAVVFDRGGFRYHGKVSALADAARGGGLVF